MSPRDASKTKTDSHLNVWNEVPILESEDSQPTNQPTTLVSLWRKTRVPVTKQSEESPSKPPFSEGKLALAARAEYISEAVAHSRYHELSLHLHRQQLSSLLHTRPTRAKPQPKGGKYARALCFLPGSYSSISARFEVKPVCAQARRALEALFGPPGSALAVL